MKPWRVQSHKDQKAAANRQGLRIWSKGFAEQTSVSTWNAARARPSVESARVVGFQHETLGNVTILQFYIIFNTSNKLKKLVPQIGKSFFFFEALSSQTLPLLLLILFLVDGLLCRICWGECFSLVASLIFSFSEWHETYFLRFLQRPAKYKRRQRKETN